MSILKISDNQFLEKEELQKLASFPFDYVKAMLKTQLHQIGIVDLPSDVNFNNLRVILGNSSNTLSLKAGIAIDKDYNVITVASDLVDTIIVPLTPVDTQYYVKIKYKVSNEEKGLFSIDAAGNLTGTGSELTKILRGQPNFPSKVRFINNNGLYNNQDYEVVRVDSDTQAVLQGVFSSQSNLKLGIVGTFTPEVSVPSADKMIYSYDGYELTLTTSDVIVEGEEFMLASVYWDGVNLTIVDAREDLFKVKSDAIFEDFTDTANPLIGLEYLKYDSKISDGSTFIARFGWGFLGTSYTTNKQNKTITISAGKGGIFQTPDDFTNGDFDGWRVYFSDGTSEKIVSSAKSSTNIVLTLRTYTTTMPTTGLLTIVPDVDFITIFAYDQTNGEGSACDVEQTFPIMNGFGVMRLKGTASVGGLKMRYKQIYNKKIGIKRDVNDGDYMNPTSFDSNGMQYLSPTYSSVASGCVVEAIDTEVVRKVKRFVEARNNSTQSVSSATGAKINIPDEITDANALFDPTTSKLKPGKVGYFRVNFKARIACSTDYSSAVKIIYISLYKNGVAFKTLDTEANYKGSGNSANLAGDMIIYNDNAANEFEFYFASTASDNWALHNISLQSNWIGE